MLSLPDKLPYLVITSVALSSPILSTETSTHSIMLQSFHAPEQPNAKCSRNGGYFYSVAGVMATWEDIKIKIYQEAKEMKTESE